MKLWGNAGFATRDVTYGVGWLKQDDHVGLNESTLLRHTKCQNPRSRRRGGGVRTI